MPSQAHSNQPHNMRQRLSHLAILPGLYPLKGVYYFIRHPFLFPTIHSRLLPCLLLSLFVLAILFLFAYLPQVAFLALFHGRAGAWINGTFLVLGEGSLVTSLLFEAWFVDETQVDIFDAVLVNEGFEELVAGGRVVKPRFAGAIEGVQGQEEVEFDSLRRLGMPTRKATYYPFSLRQIVEFVVLLPLNFIPVVGVPLFLIATGYRAGPLMGWRYYQLREFSRKERKSWIRRRRWMYAWFGTMALVLQLLPPLSMLFLLTSAAGSALFAIRLEKERRSMEVQPPPDGQEYVDDPV